jgi:DNA-binding NtrC family response regulator
MSNILIIDDSQEVLTMLGDLIQGLGHNTISTTNPLEALTIYKNDSIDLVLCDITMPEKSGLDILKEIVTYDPKAAVIVMTGMSTTEKAITTFRTGGKDYLEKPFQIIDLRKAVNSALEFRQKITNQIIPPTVPKVKPESKSLVSLLETENQSLYDEIEELNLTIKQLQAKLTKYETQN